MNARGLDLNRDWMKLEAPETRSLVGLLQEWDPRVVLDLHTTNGSAHGYELTYAGVLHPGAHPPELRDLLDHDWLPALRRRMLERHGLHVFDYGNFLSPEGEFEDDPDLLGGWRTFDHRPRFGNNYVGLRNRIAILSEAYAYLAFPERIAATRAFVTEVLRLAAARGSDVPAACRRWDAETERRGGAGELAHPLARLAFQLVDPRAEDGLLHWNWYDRWLMDGPGAELPLYAAPLPEH